MKYFYSFLLITIVSIAQSQAQNIHEPAEIFRIMDSSKVLYNMAMLDSPIKAEEGNLVLNNFYRKSINGKLVTEKYKVSPTVEAKFAKAEKYFQNQEIDKAKDMYEEILKEDPQFYMVMKYLAEMYGTNREWDKAIALYKQTIDSNYIDYMAHWFLADAYDANKKEKEALNEILTAHILNRNNPRINKAMVNILDKNNYNYTKWQFVPQMKLDSLGPNKVQVQMDSVWLGYALVKALWEYEPHYRENMSSNGIENPILEEKEALVSLYLTNYDEKAKKFKVNQPELITLKKAIEAHYIDEYVLYEILLPARPSIVFQLSEADIQKIKDYLLNIRFR